MKKAKLSLALVAGLVATIGLSSCDDATYKAGAVLTYTDANGTSAVITAKEIFEEYQKASSAKSTSFDKVYELLIRKYYANNASALKTIKSKASISVNQDMKTAASNAESGDSTYSEELEKILSNHGVETIDEDYEYWIYQHEKELFETTFYKEHIDDLRDSGFSTGALTKVNGVETASWLGNDASLKDEGYLKEKMPYHVRHILRKVSASNGELTQAKITAAEATNLSKVVTELAKGEKTFGQIANELSEDSSNTSFGDLGKMDLDESYVNEFKLGVYAYDTLYRKTAYTNEEYDNANKNRVAPITDENKKVTKTDGSEVTVNEYFSSLGIGTIPYGAFEALGKAAEVNTNTLGYKVNDNNEVFLPRNVLFNKYLNKHNVAVIVPNTIAYNEAVDSEGKLIDSNNNPDKITAYNDEGTPKDYTGLARFSETTVFGTSFNKKVLTDEKGNVILVVRAGSSGSYEGIHFIVVERSALDQVANQTTLSEYWTAEVPSDLNKTTYVNFLNQEADEYKERAEKVKGWIKGYNSNINSYIFAWLVNQDQITFADADFEKDLKSYITTKISQSKENAEKTRGDTWKTYAEFLIHQDAIREVGKTDGMGELISETCAIGYLSKDAKNGTGLWAVGGACYGK